MGLAPGGELHRLPRAAVERTFARYYEEFDEAARRAETWEAYTPYEFRVPGALLRLGWRDRAHEVLDWLFKDKRPPEWNQWPEVVWRDPRIPKFFGDLPHGWVASDFIRSVLDLFAYEDEQETGAALVIGAGIRDEWLRDGDGVVRALPTRSAARLPHAAVATRSPVVRCRPAQPAACMLIEPDAYPRAASSLTGRGGPEQNGHLPSARACSRVRFAY